MEEILRGNLGDSNTGCAGTARYMPPEMSNCKGLNPKLNKWCSKESQKTVDIQKKWDIFALGIILSDLICNPATQMEQMRIDDSIKSDPPKLPKSYKLDSLVEGELMLALCNHNPD